MRILLNVRVLTKYKWIAGLHCLRHVHDRNLTSEVLLYPLDIEVKK